MEEQKKIYLIMTNEPIYHSDSWREIFDYNGLRDFAAIWQLQTDFVEVPNKRHGGWSNVICHTLQLPQGGAVQVYIKRQLSHHYYPLLSRIRGKAFLQREYKNLLKLKKENILVPQILYFSERNNEKYQAILILRALDEFISLDKLAGRKVAFNLKKRITASVAQMVRQFHQIPMRHNCFYNKHIFVQYPVPEQDPIHIAVIDLEKAKKACAFLRASIRDLAKMYRYDSGFSRTDRLRFYKYYRQCGRLQLFDRLLIKYFERKNKQKRKKHGKV